MPVVVCYERVNEGVLVYQDDRNRHEEEEGGKGVPGNIYSLEKGID